jgi:hypothetical protein
VPDLSFVLVNDNGQRYIEVAVSKATRCYMAAVFGFENGFLNARLDSLVGSAISLGTVKLPYRRTVVRRKSMLTKIKVVLPKSIKHGAVTEDNLYNLGLHFDYFFRQQFLAFVHGAVLVGSSDNFAVVKFLEVYEIEEEILAMDTAKKIWRDFKKKNI